MSYQQRQQEFKEAVFARPELGTGSIKSTDAFGVSNSAKFIEKGLFAFNANFAQFPIAADQFVVHCLLRFPPEDEIYFTLFISSDLASFRSRLTSMLALGAAGVPNGRQQQNEEEQEDLVHPIGTAAMMPTGAQLDYAGNNKNVKGYLASDGRLYLRNKGFWDAMPENLTSISNPIIIDAVFFAIWPPAASARRSLLAREFIGYLGNLIGREKVHELRVWVDSNAVSMEMQRMPATIPLSDIEAAVTALGGHYPGGEVRRFHAALNFLTHKHFVILAGLSGTGKTQLAIAYAKAIHGISSSQTPDPFLYVCPVRPEWTDATGLTGYYDVLSNRYVVPPFLEAILLATAHPQSPVFVVLDEMNLARVEYYLSDVLSCMEAREVLRLHSDGVPLEGSNGTPIPSELLLPDNLFIVGTINIDETTNPVSDKVLDRAMVLDMSTVDVLGFLDKLQSGDATLSPACDAARTHLVPAHQIMTKHGLGFGYRVVEEFVRYHKFSITYLGADPAVVTGDLMVQKILVKLRGSERKRSVLTELLTVLSGIPRSVDFINRLIEDLDEYGSFQAAR